MALRWRAPRPPALWAVHVPSREQDRWPSRIRGRHGAVRFLEETSLVAQSPAALLLWQEELRGAGADTSTPVEEGLLWAAEVPTQHTGAWPRSRPPRSRVCLARTNHDLHLPKETTVSILPNLIGEANNSHLTSSTPPESENKHIIVFSHDKLPFCLFSALPRWHLLAAESHRR